MECRTDDELVEAIARTDRGALGALYDRHARVAFTVALHVLGDRQRAEDLIHDLFLDLARCLRDRKRVGPVFRWLVLQIFEQTS